MSSAFDGVVLSLRCYAESFQPDEAEKLLDSGGNRTRDFRDYTEIVVAN